LAREPKKRKRPRPLPVALQDLVGPFKGRVARGVIEFYRGLYFSDQLDKEARDYSAEKQNVEPAVAGEANLIGSLVQGLPEDYAHRGSLHLPVLDIDFPAHLIPSATPGHYHLYLDRPVLWDDYKNLLAALSRCGIIEHGYYRAAVADGQTFVRIPTNQELFESIDQDLDEEAR
jgi:hypothetical protein